MQLGISQNISRQVSPASTSVLQSIFYVVFICIYIYIMYILSYIDVIYIYIFNLIIYYMCIDKDISYTVYIYHIISSYIITWIPCWVTFSGGEKEPGHPIQGCYVRCQRCPFLFRFPETLDDTPQSLSWPLTVRTSLYS